MEPAGWLNYACLFVGFITEADVSAGIMEDFRVLLCCCCFGVFFFSFLSSLVGEMMSSLGVFQLSMNEIFRHGCLYLIIVLKSTKAVVKGVRDGFVVVPPI